MRPQAIVIPGQVLAMVAAVHEKSRIRDLVKKGCKFDQDFGRVFFGARIAFGNQLFRTQAGWFRGKQVWRIPIVILKVAAHEV